MFLEPQTTIWQYTHGVPDTTQVSPDGCGLDNYYLARSGADEIQLDLFLGASNVALYPAFQEYFRTSRPPLPRVLVAKGKIQDRELGRAGLTAADVYALLRQQGVDDLGQVGYLLYETRGTTTLIGTDSEPGPLMRDGLSAAGYRHVAKPAERHVADTPKVPPGTWPTRYR